MLVESIQFCGRMRYDRVLFVDGYPKMSVPNSGLVFENEIDPMEDFCDWVDPDFGATHFG